MNQSVGVKCDGASEYASEASGIKEKRKKKRRKKKNSGVGVGRSRRRKTEASWEGRETGRIQIKRCVKGKWRERERQRGREWARESCSQVMTGGPESGGGGWVGLISSDWSETPAFEHLPT